MKNNTTFIPGLALVLILAGGCCTDEALVLCDLAVALFETPDEITIGESFNTVADVINRDSDGDCEVADIADATYSLIEVFFENEDGSWSPVGSQDYEQHPLEPEEHFDLLDNLTLNQAGNYRFDFYTDSPQTVEERDETNNEASDGGKLATGRERMKFTNNYASRFIRVLPAADGRTAIAGRPQVVFQ